MIVISLWLIWLLWGVVIGIEMIIDKVKNRPRK